MKLVHCGNFLVSQSKDTHWCIERTTQCIYILPELIVFKNNDLSPKGFSHISLNFLEAMVALRISLSLNKWRSPISSPAIWHSLILMKHDGVLLEDGMRTLMS
jgi:hypothetical protein